MAQQRVFLENEFRRPQDSYGFRRIIFEWALIATALYLGTLSYYWWPIALIVLGRGQLLLDNIGHYAAHGTLFKTRALNSLLSFLYFLPVFTTRKEWAQEHDSHHKYLGTEDDPGEISFRRWRLYDEKMGRCFALAPLRELKLNFKLLNFFRNDDLSIFWKVVLAMVIVFGAWKMVVLWVLAFCTTRQWFIFISEVGEHFKAKNNHNGRKWVAGSRMFTKNFLLIKSTCDQYHWLHHMYPKISPNMLPSAHSHYQKFFSTPSMQSPKQVFAEVRD